MPGQPPKTSLKQARRASYPQAAVTTWSVDPVDNYTVVMFSNTVALAMPPPSHIV